MSNIKQDAEEISSLKDKFKAFVEGDKDATYDTPSGPKKSIEGRIHETLVVPNNETGSNKQAALDAQGAAEKAESGAAVSATAAKQDADRAVTERQQITTELSQVQALAAQVAADKLLVESTKIGDEDYVVPAVVQLLAGYADVVDVAISDAVWAEHAYKWGAPAQFVAVGLADKVVLHNLTKPGLPVWIELNNAGSSPGEWTGNAIPYNGGSGSDGWISSIACVGSLLCVGRAETAGNWYSGLIIVDFAADQIRRFKHDGLGVYQGGVADASGNKGYVEISTAVGQKLGDDDEQQHINDVAARIADDAPKHPVSGLPMPHIAVATDGGVSALTPDDQGGWSVANITGQKQPVIAITINGHMEIVASYNYQDSVAVYDFPTADIANTLYARRFYPVSSPHGSLPYMLGGSIRSMAGDLFYSSYGLTIQKQNPVSSIKGMAAHLSEDFSTSFLPGDVQSAVLCDGEEGVIVELIEEADWSAGLDGWSPESGNIVPAHNGDGSVTLTYPNGVTNSRGFKKPDLGGQLVLCVFEAKSAQSIRFRGHQAPAGYLQLTDSWVEYEAVLPDGVNFYAHGDDVTANPGCTVDIRNMRVKSLAEDRSGRNNHAKIHGTLNRSKPAGSDLAVWSGFNASNFVEPEAVDVSQPFSITVCCPAGNPHFGQADLVGQVAYEKTSFATRYSSSTNDYSLRGHGLPSDGIPLRAGASAVTLVYDGSNIITYCDGMEIGRHAGAFTSVPDAALSIGARGYAAAYSQFSDIVESVVSKTPPSPDQIRDIHRDMLNKLKKPSALTGTVKAVAHDPVRGDDWIACSDRKLHRLTPRGTTFEQTVDVPAGVGDIKSL
ncbi:MAG: hypothetical protein OIF55_16930, partial [Amphritea sp.]|nr:hypothetical protein [Amphritea sp.]